MITLLIEDRRTQTDELAEVRVPLKTAGEGFFWADASDVCGALQSGPSRIDGPAKVLTMRGKYRQTLMRISAEGTETSQSANLKVDSDRTVTIVVESVRNQLNDAFFWRAHTVFSIDCRLCCLGYADTTSQR
ncbi:hypothetical protein BC834DRAFT_820858 [Gloeopeniophorella convolvens]|nr:hypothetical protein BC834DRAFT_820858 [Gloeopeniophorella convolvens]